MRGVNAKFLRGVARARSVGLPEVHYVVRKGTRHVRLDAMKVVPINTSNVRLDPRCTRSVYRRLKRRFRTERRAV